MSAYTQNHHGWETLASRPDGWGRLARAVLDRSRMEDVVCPTCGAEHAIEVPTGAEATPQPCRGCAS